MKKIYFLLLLIFPTVNAQPVCGTDLFYQSGVFWADYFRTYCFLPDLTVAHTIDIDAEGNFIKSNLLSLTTTGSGAASYNTSTRVLNIPTNSAPGTDNAKAYSAGTVYTLTTTSQKVDFGTTDPVVTIPAPGTYLIFTNLKVEYDGLTTLLNTCNFKLRRTNNTAVDIPNATTNFGVVATLLTGTGGDVDIAPVIYTTTNSNDVLELWGNRQTGITVTGSIKVGEASIVAVRLY